MRATARNAIKCGVRLPVEASHQLATATAEPQAIARITGAAKDAGVTKGSVVRVKTTTAPAATPAAAVTAASSRRRQARPAAMPATGPSVKAGESRSHMADEATVTTKTARKATKAAEERGSAVSAAGTGLGASADSSMLNLRVARACARLQSIIGCRDPEGSGAGMATTGPRPRRPRDDPEAGFAYTADSPFQVGKDAIS